MTVRHWPRSESARSDLELAFHVSLTKTEAEAKRQIWALAQPEPKDTE